jgi:hypothetical protein
MSSTTCESQSSHHPLDLDPRDSPSSESEFATTASATGHSCGTVSSQADHSESTTVSQPQLDSVTLSLVISQGWKKLPVEVQDEILFHAITCRPTALGNATAEQRRYAAMLSTVCRRWRQVLILPEWWTKLGDGQIKYLDEFIRRSEDRLLQINMILTIDVDAVDYDSESFQAQLDEPMGLHRYERTRPDEKQIDILLKLLSVSTRWRKVSLTLNATSMIATLQTRSLPPFAKLEELSVDFQHNFRSTHPSDLLHHADSESISLQSVAYEAPNLKLFIQLGIPAISIQVVAAPNRSKLRKLLCFTRSFKTLIDIVASHEDLEVLTTSDGCISLEEMMDGPSDITSARPSADRTQIGHVEERTSAPSSPASPLRSLHLKGKLPLRFLRRFILTTHLTGNSKLERLKKLYLTQDIYSFSRDPVDDPHSQANTLPKDFLRLLPQSIVTLALCGIDWKSFEDIQEILRCLPTLKRLTFIEIHPGWSNLAIPGQIRRNEPSALGEIARAMFQALAVTALDRVDSGSDSGPDASSLKDELVPRLKSLVLKLDCGSFATSRNAFLKLIEARSLRRVRNFQAHAQARAQAQVEAADPSTASSNSSSQMSSPSTSTHVTTESPYNTESCNLKKLPKVPVAVLESVDIWIICPPVIDVDKLKESLYDDMKRVYGSDGGTSYCIRTRHL